MRAWYDRISEKDVQRTRDFLDNKLDIKCDLDPDHPFIPIDCVEYLRKSKNNLRYRNSELTTWGFPSASKATGQVRCWKCTCDKVSKLQRLHPVNYDKAVKKLGIEPQLMNFIAFTCHRYGCSGAHNHAIDLTLEEVRELMADLGFPKIPLDIP
jgi:hypothetical protein